MDISKFIPPTKSEEEAYRMGVDCAKNGPDTTNCHFALFASKEKMEAWARGKRAGEKAKTK